MWTFEGGNIILRLPFRSGYFRLYFSTLFDYLFVLFWCYCPAPRQCHGRSLSFTAPLEDYPIPVKWYHYNSMLCSKKGQFWLFGLFERLRAQKGKRTLFLAKQTYEKWHAPLLQTGQNPLDVYCEWQRRHVKLSKRRFRVSFSKKKAWAGYSYWEKASFFSVSQGSECLNYSL